MTTASQVSFPLISTGLKLADSGRRVTEVVTPLAKERPAPREPHQRGSGLLGSAMKKPVRWPGAKALAEFVNGGFFDAGISVT